LEQSASPFDEQLAEAVKFFGGKLKDQYRIEAKHSSNSSAGRGREEYILRWLLKKLQSKDDVPRKTPLSWHLFSHLLQVIPLTTAAKILQERKFMIILRQTLEEVQKAVRDITQDVSEITPGSAPREDFSFNVSKKRNHLGELVASDTVTISGQSLADLLEAIYGAIHGMILSTDVVRNSGEQGRSAAFSAEYMRSVMRTTAEEAAKILGAWLSLSRLRLGHSDLRDLSGGRWISQFTKIWEFRIAATEDLMHFSLHCSPSVLSLLQAIKSRNTESDEWVPELEQLIARNIMLPTKTAQGHEVDSDQLKTLTRVLVIQDSANAPLLFEVAIRSIQPHGSHRRRSQDNIWLQTVFSTLREALLPQRSEQNCKAIRSMLQSAIKHKVSFELSILRSVTSAYALTEESTNWELLNTIIMLDANVFLIPEGEKDLLKQVFTRITAVSLHQFLPEIPTQIVSDVVVPLMKEFANARDLSGFIRHWYASLVKFEEVREDRNPQMMSFSAWEDDRVQHELSKLFVPSLTLHQISELLDFLGEEVADHPAPVSVVLEAIAGSISYKDIEVVDAVQTRIYHIMFDDGSSEKLKDRYKWRSWKIFSRILSWLAKPGLEEISKLWEERAPPFNSLSGRIGVGSLLEVGDEDMVELETLEFLRCGCAAWKRTEECPSLESFAKASMLDFLHCLARDVKSFTPDLASAQKLGEEVCGTHLNTQYRGIGWMVWSYVRCVFVEYPESLE
jgi:nucleolar pre-ribosomal-associated protein 2